MYIVTNTTQLQGHNFGYLSQYPNRVGSKKAAGFFPRRFPLCHFHQCFNSVIGCHDSQGSDLGPVSYIDDPVPSNLTAVVLLVSLGQIVPFAPRVLVQAPRDDLVHLVDVLMLDSLKHRVFDFHRSNLKQFVFDILSDDSLSFQYVQPL